MIANTDRSRAFADWFRTLLAPTVRLAPTWREKWAKTYGDMIRLDGRTPEQIAAVCKWARAHEFWQANFLSPVKLRERDRSGTMYFDRFLAAMNPGGARRAAKQSTQQPEAPNAATVIEHT
jgi:hypothetical protein